ncbi:MAG: VWA domain-containing protein [Acidobacteria bacterium]|nr:VWA domain-containing protein [Acidobacteriota bacterium]
MSARRGALVSTRLRGALAACVCALALCASSSPALRAQSGRRSSPPAPETQGKKAATVATATPTPTPARVLEGPIAEPPSPSDPKTKGHKQGTGIRPPEAASKTPKTAATPDEDEGEEVVHISSNLVPLPASVVDAQGRAVADLKAEDFELLVDGQAQPIGDVARAETPVSLALLFDNSSSQVASREFERQAGIRFLESVIRPVDRAAVFSISTEPELSQPLTNDVKALVRTIRNFQRPDAAATALFDTVYKAADYLKPQRTRKVIVIISDGTDTVSDLGFDETMAQLIADDCQVYAVETGNSDSLNLHDPAGQHRLEEFAAQTGGAVYVPHTHDELNAAFKQIATDLSQQYVLSYYPSGDIRDGRFRRFTLNVKTRPGLRVRTRKGYYAPKGT